MWPFTPKPKPKDDEYRKIRWRTLWTELVPPSGEAETWQGEILRIIAKAEDEANRNGFVNWDDENNREIDLFVDWLCRDETFDTSAKDEIHACADRIKTAGSNIELALPTDADWDYLHFRAVDWCDAHPTPIFLHGESDYIGHD